MENGWESLGGTGVGETDPPGSGVGRFREVFLRPDKSGRPGRYRGMHRRNFLSWALILQAIGLPGPGLSETRAGSASGEEAKPDAAPAPAPVVEIVTSMGTISLQLDPERAPATVANFLKYAAAGHYDGTVFHRVVGGYIVQGGGFAKQGDQLVEKPTGEPIRNEADNGLKNAEGTIAMARTDAPDTATAQFFINCRDNELLDHSPAAAGYAVFGRVTKGLDVVMQINGVPTGVREVQGLLGTGQHRPMPLKGVPLSDVVIESVRVVEPAADRPAENPPAEQKPAASAGAPAGTPAGGGNPAAKSR